MEHYYNLMVLLYFQNISKYLFRMLNQYSEWGGYSADRIYGITKIFEFTRQKKYIIYDLQLNIIKI